MSSTIVAARDMAVHGPRQLAALMIKGSCLCGSVRYVVQAEIEHAENCHCAMCRKAHSSAYSTNALVPTDSLHVEGVDHLSSFRSSPTREKLFCSKCGSQLFIKRLNSPEGTVITMGTLDDDPMIRPTRHVFTQSKAPWHEVDGRIPAFKIYPGHEPPDD